MPSTCCGWRSGQAGVVERQGAQGAVGEAPPTFLKAHSMRAFVLCGNVGGASRPRSTAELEEAAVHFDRTAALANAPAVKAQHTSHIRSALAEP